MRSSIDRWLRVSTFLAEEASKVVKAAVVLLLAAILVTVALSVYFGEWGLVWDLLEFVGRYVEILL